ncbi:MAG: group III truncated hemoglobin [Opitutales bacterium]
MGRRDLFERIGGRSEVLRLLQHFYADVRQHQVIGPIFAAHIHDWPAHLEKLADFWQTATGGSPTYRGAMPMKHIPLRLQGDHFVAWLDLWRRNCRIYLPAKEAGEMIALAEVIGGRLSQISRDPRFQAVGHELVSPESSGPETEP